ncbi:hypothetical protein Pmar_PMAR000535 [Perkinsus marinus ATCC 50983]|uniref:Uncharacterized protein n=1 Tax=Perkinsus marinus (strain ATCC 50983 / TXsc) TaxID=423536 RepID=C5LIW3_PERM5|nr:hypothetical protein Pmar_PMAR000535 [Perkinsus marinus ATCC 50983]EER03298.1 hypothetical protein Pmar_PMAR000535 [Perkinsus marinus ATCC 50983]|eukprot:XP_002771482.1 hypothetical protein Pmar_PMAR000535 [Perkinsus marinus ATCC 50983]
MIVTSLSHVGTSTRENGSHLVPQNANAQHAIIKCRSLFQSHGTLSIVTGVASLIALEARKLMQRTGVDLHALFAKEPLVD